MTTPTNALFLEECRGFAIDVILDVGADSGQFAQDLRVDGCRGQIVSFEPLSQAHAVLAAVAASDPLWDVTERCAVGASDRSAEINIADNSCAVTLDAFIERTFTDPTTLFGLKIDRRMHEMEVLAGLNSIATR